MPATQPREMTIDLDSLDQQDRADLAAIAAAGGWDMADIDLTHPPVAVLAGLLYVTRRRHFPHLTPDRCVRWAMQARVKYEGGDDGR